LVQRVFIDLDRLPYRRDVLDYLWQEKRMGRTILLVTSADGALAQAMAQPLKLFDMVIASEDQGEQHGEPTVERIRNYLKGTPFAYIGRSPSDFSLWRAAAESLAVAPRRSVLARLQTIRPPQRLFAGHPNGSVLCGMIRALRLSQWTKNLLLAVPLVMSHELGNPGLWGKLGCAFIAFGCCASSGYLLNDLLDLEADRHHPRKRHRPFASGQSPLPIGLAGFLGLLVVGLGLAAWTVPGPFIGWLALYLVLTFTYSVYCKRQLIVDAIFLAALYTLRVIAGGAVVEVDPTRWLLAFAMFFFLSLAFAKRYAELRRLADENLTHAKGRSYVVEDLEVVGNLGVTSGYLSVLVFTLYLNSSPVVPQLYPRSEILWLISPVLLYWISRVWLLVRRGVLHEDPVVFTLTDRISYVCGGLILLLALLATHLRG